MKGFKDSTRTKYMCGGPVKKARGGMMEEGVPAHSSKPMIRRSKGGLTAMPKGKC